ncbi:unnamed protein product [Musa acuminata subsp. malaccensis]|uniref:(wild Malaysian banana) hypothetical protein n=1 Tax=Musa acuminata subsp. malaccensis TaxID=214687 RepID=A0A804HQX8_MUSAM|nr:unnamed protein product [Musa acuminata subsp. malaccensis]
MREGGSASNLAVVERKETRRKPGGCIGVFFQLFDWKKKKQFPKKLFPPVTAAKRVLRRIGGHEKLTVAKHLLVPQENSGGIAAVKRAETGRSCSSQDSLATGMCTPGLVARLMGLESMPAAHHDNTRHALTSDFDDVQCLKVGSRPQKLPKTGRFLKNRRATGNASRIGSDALQLNMSLEQQRKLALLLKSQRTPSKRKKARLVEVATKILEPGLQSRNRLKFGITGVGISSNIAEGSDAPFLSKKPDEPLCYDFLLGSCTSCGNLVEVVDLRSTDNAAQGLDHGHGALDSDYGSASSLPSSSCDTAVLGSEKRVRTLPIRGEDIKRSSSLITAKGQSRATHLALEAKTNSVHSRDRKCSVRNEQDMCRMHESIAPKQNNWRLSQSTLSNENLVSGSRQHSRQCNTRGSNAVIGTKKFAAANKSFESRTLANCRTRASKKNVMKLGKCDLDQDNMVPKGRPMSNGAFMKQRNLKKELVKSKISGSIGNHLRNRTSIRSDSQEDAKAGGRSRKTNSTSPSMLNSRTRQVSGSTSHQNKVERSKAFNELTGCTSPKELVLSQESEKLSSQNEIEEDALFAYLEDKITDLSCLDENNLQADHYFPGISSLSILERMISTLLNRGSSSPKNTDRVKNNLHLSCIDSSDDAIFDGQRAKTTEKVQVGVKSRTSAVCSTSCDDHPNLMTALEVSLPTDGCFCWDLSCTSGENLSHLLWLRFVLMSQMFLSKNRLAKSIEEEIIRWHHMAGKSLTELIEQDVQHPSSDWPSSKLGGSAEIRIDGRDDGRLKDCEQQPEVLPGVHCRHGISSLVSLPLHRHHRVARKPPFCEIPTGYHSASLLLFFRHLHQRRGADAACIGDQCSAIPILFLYSALQFPTVYHHLTASSLSFVGSFDDASKTLADRRYFPVFREHCRPPCYVNEHYLPTLVTKLFPGLNSNRSLTWVDWSRGGAHPATYRRRDVSVGLMERTRNDYSNNTTNTTTMCFLFARKLEAAGVAPLLQIAGAAMHLRDLKVGEGLLMLDVEAEAERTQLPRRIRER